MSEPLLVGIDAGTTNIKAVAFTPAGRLVAAGSQPTPAVHSRPGWAHYEPEALWQAVVGALRRMLAGVDDPGRIAGLAVASMAETAIPLDGQGQPTYDAIAWFDRRATGELALLVERMGFDRLFEISGLAAQPIFGLCKMMWLKANAPEAYASTRRWLNTADYIAWRLSGVAATDYSLAGRTFALDLKGLRWSDEVIDAAGVRRELFQPLVASGAALGPVSAEAAAATGLPVSCIVGAGGFDHAVGAVGVGAFRPGVLLNSIGTTDAFLLRLERPATDPAIGRQGYALGVLATDRPNYFVIGGTFTAGAAIEWFRHSFAGGASYETLLAEAAAVPPGADGVGFLPHLRLAPPPFLYPHPRGAFWGLTTDTSRGMLFRALLEGLIFEARQCADAMLAVEGAPPVDAILAIGGGTRDRLRMQIKASLWRRPITVVEVSEGVSLGASMLAGLAAGVHADPEAAGRAVSVATRTVEPDEALGAVYERLYQEVFRTALPQLRPLHDAAVALLGAGGTPTPAG